MDSPILLEILRQVGDLREEFKDYTRRNDERMRALLLAAQAERKEAAAHRAQQAARTVPPPSPEPAPGASARHPAPQAPVPTPGFFASLAAPVAAGGWPFVVVVGLFFSPIILLAITVASWASGAPLPSVILALVGVFHAASASPQP